jgi:hypothetical protein
MKKASLAVRLSPLTDELLTGIKERAFAPTRRFSGEESGPTLNGETLELNLLLGNEPTETQLPLHGLRIRFLLNVDGEPPVTSSELPGESRVLEKVSDPWFISADGKQDAVVEGGAWSLEPVSWGRLDDGAGVGKYCLWFWVDLTAPMVKNGFGIPEGRRLYFAINLLEKAALPNLFADIQKLEAKIASSKEMGRQKAKNIWEWIAFANSYNERTLYEAQLSTLAMGVPSSSHKLIDVGGFSIPKDITGVVALRQGQQFGQVGTFTIKGEVGRDNSQATSLAKEAFGI